MKSLLAPCTLAMTTLALLLAGCGDNGEQAGDTDPSIESEPEAPPPPPPQPAPEFTMTLPGPDQADPVALLAYWKGAVEAGETAAARRAWRKEIRTGGTAPRWANLKSISVEFGEGEQDGGAGSLFYAVPVTLTGTSVDQLPVELTGTMMLRRINEVPDASADQLSWRIESIDWDG